MRTFASWILVARGAEAGHAQLSERAAHCLKKVSDYVESTIGTMDDCALNKYACRTVITLLSRIGTAPGIFKDNLYQLGSEGDQVHRDGC